MHFPRGYSRLFRERSSEISFRSPIRFAGLQFLHARSNWLLRKIIMQGGKIALETLLNFCSLFFLVFALLLEPSNTKVPFVCMENIDIWVQV